MTPSARLQAAIEVLSALENAALPADRFLRDWFARRRYAGSKDRAAVAERVYDVLRHRASYAWRMGSDAPRALAIASLLAGRLSADAVETLFDGSGYGPAPLTDTERAAMASPPDGAPPLHVEGEFPPWLEPELARAFGGNLLTEMRAMRQRAPVDLRVNTLKADRNDMLVGLAGLGLQPRPTPYSPYGIRLDSAEGLSALQHTAFFQTGAVEFQDESSQIAAMLCGAEPGMRVLDFAAGGGGKSLALAALMENRGEIVGFDETPERMKALGPRARRAGARIVKVASARDALGWGAAAFDIVLLDVPCSGSGTWRRNPDLKWRLTPARLDALVAVQAAMIRDAAPYVKRGGRLVYATCSVLPRENGDQIAQFLGTAPGFGVTDAISLWRKRDLPVPPGLGRCFMATPAATGTNGFYTCVMTRD